jgi:hypothetical protein
MRKQESVHLHALLAAVAEEFDDRVAVPSPDRSAYEELGVTPTMIHRSKGDHEEAVLVLADAIERSIHEQATPGSR